MATDARLLPRRGRGRGQRGADDRVVGNAIVRLRRRKSESGRAEPGRRTLETGRKRPRSDSGLIVAARVGEDPLQALGRACWTATDQLTPDLVSLEIVWE